MSYFDNLKVIARGGGSSQARYHDRDCPICNDREEEEEEEKEEKEEQFKDIDFMDKERI